MQIKPAFTEYTEHWREKVCVDDMGVQYDLVCFSGKSDSFERLKKKNYRVMSDALYRWQNGATSYNEHAYFRNATPPFWQFPTIRGFKIYPVYRGSTGNIDGGVVVEFICVKQWPWATWWGKNITNKRLYYKYLYWPNWVYRYKVLNRK